MAKEEVMTVAGFKKLLQEYPSDIIDEFQVWLSSDEEGNEFLPMLQNQELCLAIDPEQKRIILFPSHR